MSVRPSSPFELPPIATLDPIPSSPPPLKAKKIKQKAGPKDKEKGREKERENDKWNATNPEPSTSTSTKSQPPSSAALKPPSVILTIPKIKVKRPRPKPPAKETGHEGENANNSDSRERVKGQTTFPLTRVQKIMHADHEAAMTSREALFIVTAATEELLKRLAGAAYQSAQAQRHVTIMLQDVAKAVESRPELQFLQGESSFPLGRKAAHNLGIAETIPRTMPIGEAMELYHKRVQERADAADGVAVNDPVVPSPAMNGHATPSPSNVPTPESEPRPSLPVQTNGHGRMSLSSMLNPDGDADMEVVREEEAAPGPRPEEPHRLSSPPLLGNGGIGRTIYSK